MRIEGFWLCYLEGREVNGKRVQRAERANQVWSRDFLEDQTARSTKLQMLTLIDEYTRQCLAIHEASSVLAMGVITVGEAAIERYGMPEHNRSDNGPEFIAYSLQDWLQERSIKTMNTVPVLHGRIRTSNHFTTSSVMNLLIKHCFKSFVVASTRSRKTCR
jgi:transposase InsO family protein